MVARPWSRSRRLTASIRWPARRGSPAAARCRRRSRRRDGVARAVADLSLFVQLGLKPGDRITLGNLPLILADTLESEPDKIAGGVGYGPRVMMSIEALRQTGLIQPGSLVRWRYRVALPPAVPPAAPRPRPTATFAQSGWDIRTRDDASPELKRNIERFTMFLTLVGLTALLVGGVGVANAVRAFVERKRETVATLKTLGAPGRLGRRDLPDPDDGSGALSASPSGSPSARPCPSPSPGRRRLCCHCRSSRHSIRASSSLALAYGLLTAFAFSLWPLGRAHDVPVSALFREGDRAGPEPAALALPRPRRLAVADARRPRHPVRLRTGASRSSMSARRSAPSCCCASLPPG